MNVHNSAAATISIQPYGELWSLKCNKKSYIAPSPSPTMERAKVVGCFRLGHVRQKNRKNSSQPYRVHSNLWFCQTNGLFLQTSIAELPQRALSTTR